MSDPQDNLLAENALIDAKQVAASLDRKFVDADIPQYHEHGIDLLLGAEVFVQRYDGTNKFVNDVLKGRFKQWKKLTSAQARAALNIMRQELGHQSEEEQEKSTIKCFSCDYEAPTWDDLLAHKSQMHGSKQEAPPVIAEIGEAKAVIANTTSTKGLDLTNLPDGRYAAPDPTGNNDYRFLMVKRVRKTHKRDRRYNYGKVVTGNEVVVAGTIEVKEWSSDSKELLGEQKPGDLYRGDYEDSLELILLAPEPFAITFGKLIGRCCICGKTLTDDVSRAIGMGFECEKKVDYFKNRPTSYIGEDRPDKEHVDPNDARYLSGELRRYVEPKHVVITTR